MKMLKMLLIAATGTIIVLAPYAGATHPEPGPKAKKVVADLVMAYEPCTVPDTATDGLGYPACAAPVRSDPGCGFGPKGKGKLKISVSPSKMKVIVSLRGLDVGCEASVMAVILRGRATGDGCAGAPCTTTDAFASSWSACTVTGGKCVISAAVAAFPYLPQGARTGVELHGADVIRDGTLRPFATGFVLP